jgi:hypothetical protein
MFHVEHLSAAPQLYLSLRGFLMFHVEQSTADIEKFTFKKPKTAQFKLLRRKVIKEWYQSHP